MSNHGKSPSLPEVGNALPGYPLVVESSFGEALAKVTPTGLSARLSATTVNSLPEVGNALPGYPLVVEAFREVLAEVVSSSGRHRSNQLSRHITFQVQPAYTALVNIYC